MHAWDSSIGNELINWEHAELMALQAPGQSVVVQLPDVVWWQWRSGGPGSVTHVPLASGSASVLLQPPGIPQAPSSSSIPVTGFGWAQLVVTRGYNFPVATGVPQKVPARLQFICAVVSVKYTTPGAPMICWLFEKET